MAAGSHYAATLTRACVMRHVTFALTVVLFLALPRTTRAQIAAGEQRFALLGQFAGVTSNEFSGTDRGFGGLFSWHRLGPIAVEAEMNYYPKNLTLKGGAPFSRGRVEGLFGISAGPLLGRMRPFGTFRTGFVTFRSAPGPLACPAIFPPTLSCELARGEAVIATVVGGGVEAFPIRHVVVRIELGDRLTNYPGPTIDASGEAHSMAFWSNEFRLVAGAGVRF
jgi:hypothetical protein